ncbi:MAG TPA: hypothetical protein VJ673_04000, partial [Aromatoleum sp.]|uniref:hypothetical protein n=1 Tax=Aromatoleum sp. TaxID=2307007 RepID=UPI002B47ECD2
ILTNFLVAVKYCCVFYFLQHRRAQRSFLFPLPPHLPATSRRGADYIDEEGCVNTLVIESFRIIRRCK